ncbi:MAG: helix-hairpin-helix domain-containing protein [Clostridia bacterium]|nr:helix-hairpin-helix domain-containing protein [Clostridia bacterium]
MSNMDIKQKIVFIGMLIIMVIVIAYYFLAGEETEYVAIENDEITEETNIREQNEIVVHITGSVAQEGIVKLKEGARIVDAIEEAGGATSDANLKDVNLAYKLKDGQKLYIPSNIDDNENITIVSTKGDGVVDVTKGDNDKININEATQSELETLSGIGPSMAKKIIEYREKNGSFSSIDDIKNVPGIGDSKFEAIKDNIEV